MLQHDASLDDAFRALADPTRRAIVDQLCRGPASASTVAEPLDMSLSAVLQHLRVLEDAGLVVTQKAGRTRTCTLASDQLRNLERWIHARRTVWENRLDRLGEVLAASEEEGEDDDA